MLSVCIQARGGCVAPAGASVHAWIPGILGIQALLSSAAAIKLTDKIAPSPLSTHLTYAQRTVALQTGFTRSSLAW